MKAKNLSEFKALIKRYESITLEEIKEAFTESYSFTTAERLTGFNSSDCSLCKAVGTNCYICVYALNCGCLYGENSETYNRIYNADTPIKLRNAFRDRARHMKTLLKP